MLCSYTYYTYFDPNSTLESKICINILKNRCFTGAKINSEPLEDGVDYKAVIRKELHAAIAECMKPLIQLLVQLLCIKGLKWRAALKKQHNVVRKHYGVARIVTQSPTSHKTNININNIMKLNFCGKVSQGTGQQRGMLFFFFFRGHHKGWR